MTLGVGEYRSGGRVFDADGREVVAVANTSELGYAEKTNGVYAPTTVDGRKDIPNLSVITFDVIAGEVVYVEAFVPHHVTSTLRGSGVLYISDNAGADAAAAIKAATFGPESYGATANTKLGMLRAVERITAAGTYSRKAQVQSLVGTVSFQSGTGASGISPLSLRAYTQR